MKKIFFPRLFQLFSVIWGVGTLTFILMRALPGDMAYRIAASRYGQDNVSSAAADLVRQELHLDQGLFVAYFSWLKELVQGNLGRSLVSDEPVWQILQHMLGHSLLLALVALLLSFFIAVPLGLLGATFGKKVDQSIVVFSTAVRAMPVFVVGLVFILLFSIHWNWLPVAGFGTPAHIVLPALSLALTLAAISNRVVRNAAINTFQASFYRFAQVKGLSSKRTFMRHGIRHIALPVVAFLGIQLVGMIEGIVMIESLFSWPGIGHGLAHAIFARDIPVIQGAALLMGILFVVLNTLVDLICYRLDPRARSQA